MPNPVGVYLLDVAYVVVFVYTFPMNLKLPAPVADDAVSVP